MGFRRIFFIFLLIFICSSNFCKSVFTIKSANPNDSLYLRNATTNEKSKSASLPIVINTWPFTEASSKAWEVLVDGGSALDAVEQGCTICEELQCDGTVGFGGSPDENGETTLDAMIMDGETHDVGAVGALRRIKSAISVARKILEKTDHTLLVGSQATDFAILMGFKEENLSTPVSEMKYKLWKVNNCQPNFWKNVVPNPAASCGPYHHTNPEDFANRKGRKIDKNNHDTIGMVAIDSLGRIAGGTSTNGASHKIPGRVGDSPIPGSGAYVDRNIGGAAATGDGDIMMRFMPSLVAVDFMRSGMNPDSAANAALERITSFYPAFSGAIVTLNINGTYGAACYNLPNGVFNYTVANLDLDGVEVISIPCIDEDQNVITKNTSNI